MFHFFARILFLVGFLIGFLLTVFLIRNKPHQNDIVHLQKSKSDDTVYQKWFASSRLTRKNVDFDTLRYSNNVNSLSEARFLFKEVRVLCLVLVRRVANAEAANNTWGRGCNALEYVQLHNNKTKRRIVPVRSRTKEKSSWVLLCKTLLRVKDFHWVVIVNDNSFVVVENLRRLVAGLDYKKGHYLGHAVTFWTTIYNTGQAGYVLSWGSVRAIREKFNDSAAFCTSEITYLNQEDMYLGKHLASLNITAVDTRDANGLTRFFPHNWNQIFFPTSNTYRYSVYPVVCCSKLAITFQAIEAHKIYMYYYLLYKLAIFNGGSLGNRPAPTPIPEEQVWRRFLNGSNEKISAQLYYKLWVEQIHDPTSFARELRKSQDYFE